MKSFRHFAKNKINKTYSCVIVLIMLFAISLSVTIYAANLMRKNVHDKKVTQYLDFHTKILDQSLSDDFYNYINTNLYHFLRTATWGNFFTESKTDEESLTRLRFSAIDSMRLQKNLKSMILYRMSDSLLLSSLSTRTDFSDANPAYPYVSAMIRSRKAMQPGFYMHTDGNLYYYFPYLSNTAASDLVGCVMVQLRSPAEYFQIHVDELNSKGTFLILSDDTIIHVEGANILSQEVIESAIHSDHAADGQLFSYRQPEVPSYLFYCLPSSQKHIQYIYYEPENDSRFSIINAFDNTLVSIVFSVSFLFCIIALVQYFRSHHYKTLAEHHAAEIQKLSSDTLFPDSPLSHYAGILIEYQPATALANRTQFVSMLCNACEQYLSGCLIKYNIVPQQFFICCYLNYEEYNMRVLSDSLKQLLYNVADDCQFIIYFTNALNSPDAVLEEMRYLQQSLHYTKIIGYGHRMSLDILRACDCSTDIIEEHVTSHLLGYLSNKHYDKALAFLEQAQQSFHLSFSANSTTHYSYNTLYHFMDSSLFAIKGFFLEKSFSHPITELNMNSMLESKAGYHAFFQYLISAIQEYQQQNEHSVSDYERDFMESIFHYIDQNLTSVTLNSMAEHFHVSSAHLSRLFKKNTEQNFSEYLSEKKLQKAILLLEQDNKMTINDIAKELGYSTPAYFLTKFKERFGITPSAYRKNYLSQSRDASHS